MSAVFQHGYYIGNNFNTIIYGVELTVYILTIQAIRRRRQATSTDKLLIAFSTAILLLNTIFVATESVFGEEMWIVNADYPGGSSAYIEDFASVWYQTFGTAASIVLNLFSDALMIYRCYIVWGDLRVVLFPVVLYLATFSLGIAQLVASGKPHSNYFAGLAQKLGTAYTSSIISLEIILTSLICGRILYVAHKLGRGSAHARTYTSYAAITIESALPCTLLGIAYLVPFARGDDISIFFLSIYVMSTCLAPQMIILRMVSGHAWTLKTTETITTASTTEEGIGSATCTVDASAEYSTSMSEKV
ncbi:hypothetical protein BN946_scf185016.g8 [Trametes cinnabarina]|uniref:G protein-coupled receptor n=1 Tax=Pycnoporus cinnabarinus TaxID=5643 RepID=A0A060SI64_PYCCI|nr:hypothetical protein BN946_scf185016.g8 [Trametes cinnabarina]